MLLNLKYNGLNLQRAMEIISGGQGNDGPSDQTTPCTPHTAPILSTEQSTTCFATSLRAAEGESDGAPPTIDVVEEGVDAGLDRDVEAFPGSSRVTSTGSTKCTFLVNEELVPGNYKLFNLFFIICV